MTQSEAVHPEFGGEQLHLAATREAIAKEVEAPLKVAMGDFAATLYMESYRAWRRMQLREAVEAPYFARLEFTPDDRTKPETYYVGKTYFGGEGVDVTGWQAPVAALFYRATDSRASYVAPQGEIAGALSLKRRLVIDHGELRHVADDLDERPLSAGGAPRATGGAPSRDDVLRAVLSDHASPWLRDIVVTIQPDQYALITAPGDQVLLVQGAAGSGKTSIALHRLSYLVYPKLVAGTLPPRCIVFGPNRLFLKYVSAVLPKLGLQHVVQTTVAEWAMARLGLEKARLTDTTFEALLSQRAPAEEKDRREQTSRLKTSRLMGTLLERYVEWRRGQVAIPDGGWLFEVTVPRFSGSLEQQRLRRRLEPAELRAAHAKHAVRPLAIHRALFMEEVLALVTASLAPASPPAEIEMKRQLGRKRLQQAEEHHAEIRRLRAQLDGAAAAPRPSGAPALGASSRGASSGGAGRPLNESLLSPGFSLPSSPSSGGPRPAGPSLEGRSFTAGTLQPGGSGASRRDGSGAVPRDPALLRQTIRQLELAAERRQQEGDALIAEADAATTATLAPEVREEALKRARAEVRRLVDIHWVPVEPVRDYYALLADSPLLQQLADGVFSDDDLALIAGSGKRAPGAVDASDLPGLHYLFVLSQEPDDMGAVNHDFVVVDEAQDLSEVDLLCLRALERKQSFTLLGDVAQSVYAHRGLTSWEPVAAAFGDRPVSYEECAVSYRTTAEITAVANRVLRSLGSEALTTSAAHAASPAVTARSGAPAAPATPAARQAVAFERHGHVPDLVQIEGEAALIAAVQKRVQAALTRGQLSVAVITRSVDRARVLYEALVLEQADTQLIATHDMEYGGGVVVLPVHLAKGLEFDAVIVVDAGAETYTRSAFDGRLLYVALTRAMHELQVLYQGDPSPHLAG